MFLQEKMTYTFDLYTSNFPQLRCHLAGRNNLFSQIILVTIRLCKYLGLFSPYLPHAV